MVVNLYSWVFVSKIQATVLNFPKSHAKIITPELLNVRTILGDPCGQLVTMDIISTYCELEESLAFIVPMCL